jgi:uncharacterized membrane protein
MTTALAGDAGSTRHSRRNMSRAEQWGSVAAGAALTLYGLGIRKGGGLLLAAAGAMLVRRGATGHCDVYQALGVDKRRGQADADTRQVLGGAAGVKVHQAVTVNRPAAELYEFWRTLENLPRFMSHVESVQRVSDGVSHWRVKGPGRTRFEWEAQVINDIPNELIAWKSIGHPSVVSAGSVHFEDAGVDRGTRVRVKLQYSPPGGKAGAAVAKIFGRDAATEIREDLRKFKQILEAGEIATTQGQPRGGR